MKFFYNYSHPSIIFAETLEHIQYLRSEGGLSAIFVNIRPGPNVITLYTDAIYVISYSARAFV
jgi:hypothetical protein